MTRALNTILRVAAVGFGAAMAGKALLGRGDRAWICWYRGQLAVRIFSRGVPSIAARNASQASFMTLGSAVLPSVNVCATFLELGTGKLR